MCNLKVARTILYVGYMTFHLAGFAHPAQAQGGDFKHENKPENLKALAQEIQKAWELIKEQRGF